MSLADRLAGIAGRSTLRLTTRGRRTGRPHTVTVWFVIEGTTMYLATLNAKRDWVRNLARNPEATFDVGGLGLRGQVTTIGDPALAAHVGRLLAQKYWMAWIGSWLGRGADRTFRVDGLELSGGEP